MRAVSRWYVLLSAGAFALVPAPVSAQEAPTTNTPAPPPETVGPTELQNFSINGTVTRPADQPADTQPAAQERRAPPAAVEPSDQPARTPPSATSSQGTPQPRQERSTRGEAARSAEVRPPAQSVPEPLRQSQPSSSITASLPSLGASGTGSATAAPAQIDFPATPGTLAPERSFPFLPWLLVALALALGGGFLLWRSRLREAYAGGPEFDAFVAPEPAPPPPPAPQPSPPHAAPLPPPAQVPPVPVPQPAGAAGVVSTRLRPWLEIGFNPTRCILSDDALIVEFELELFNSGSAAARNVRVDAAIFNAGIEQEREVGNFIANPVGHGESIEIAPLKRVGLKTQVAIASDQVKPYEIAGKQVFLPVIAFNAIYGWGAAQGQTSASYLLGRATGSEKLGPFRIDLGPRIFRGVAAKLLPTALRQ